MEVGKYQDIIKQTAVYPKEIGLLYCTLGLCGESGEVAEKVKKAYRDSHGNISTELRTSLIKELGDIVWYVTAAANEIGAPLSEVLQVNYDKLIARRATNTLHGNGDNREEDPMSLISDEV